MKHGEGPARQSAAHILLVEDDPIMGESLRTRLEIEGYTASWAKTVEAARKALAGPAPDIVISDIRLPDGNGEQLLEWIHDQLDHPPPVLFMTAYGTIDQAVRLLKHGASDYLTKPLDIEQLLQGIRKALNARGWIAPESATRALGVSEAMRAVEDQLVKLAQFPETPVLLHGESGVGKEVAARYLHDLQAPDQPFEAINCAAIPESLIGSELFGHEKGAFTGANQRHAGLFERAAGGIAFLDEIGDMPLALQPTLLRLLQERQFLRLGGNQPVEARCRILFATHQNLRQQVLQGNFREDLYYRINVVQVEIPPLRERRSDIPWLAERFLHAFNSVHPESPRRLSAEALDLLGRHDWPGNVRELKNTIERACILARDTLITPAELALNDPPAPAPDTALAQHLKQDEREYIIAMLRAHGLRVQETAQALGISRKTLWQKMKRYGIDRDKL